ncbi:S-adenosyl-L-methionine-dependent methyltransferase [Lyophyllum atratum]|nr:S-adenosyl-L-methionine-dependent methyltransferase [Lyophyllum atratum]
MATFAKKAFNASVYSSFRPTYPKKLFKEIFDYHRSTETARWDVAVDLGCGTGQATTELKSHFSSVTGIDPSQPMIDAAQKKHQHGGLTFRQGRSEDLRNVLADDSVDLVISAQAGHWFDWDLVWPEVSRVLRTGGTAAFWTYAEIRVSEYPTTTSLISAYAQGKDPATSLGPYFERPGRTILENMLTDVPDPTQMESVMNTRGGLVNFERRYFAGTHFPTQFPPPSPTQIRPVEMRKTMRWRDLLGYLRTWSALHNFHERFPEDLERVDERFPEDKVVGPAGHDLVTGMPTERVDVDVSGGDIAVRFWKDLREEVKKNGGRYGVDELVSVEWPIALLLANKV